MATLNSNGFTQYYEELVTNHLLSSTSVYLMNATAPEDAMFRIVVQKRNEQQSNSELDFNR